MFEGTWYEERLQEFNDEESQRAFDEDEEYYDPPNPNDYMPNWPNSEKTHYMMYEDCSEGTPISPAFETPGELARWLADNKASSCGDMTTSYDAWLNMITKEGSSISMVIMDGRIIDGVTAMMR